MGDEVRLCSRCGSRMKPASGGRIKILAVENIYVCPQCGHRKHAFEWILGHEMFEFSIDEKTWKNIQRNLRLGNLSRNLRQEFVKRGIEISGDFVAANKGSLWEICSGNMSFVLGFDYLPELKNKELLESNYEGYEKLVVYSGGYKPYVWDCVQKYFFAKFSSVSTLRNPNIENLHWRILTDYPRRKGKYVRPGLLLMTCEALGGPMAEGLLTAAAMQTSEDWILVHDDFEDNSDKRRGSDTLHKSLGEDFGKELAVNAGDALHIIMWKMLVDNLQKMESSKFKAIMNEFYEMLMRTTLGQTAEIRWTRSDFKLSYDDVYYIIDGKTGYYTIAGPMRLGSIVANANDEELRMMFSFGSALGRAFQITDDLLDLTTDFAGLKKKANDIYEGKRTIMLTHLIQNASITDKNRIAAVFKKFLRIRALGIKIDRRKKEEMEKDVKQILDLMTKYGSIKFGRREAEKYAKKSLHVLERFDFINERAKNDFKLAIDFMVNREF